VYDANLTLFKQMGCFRLESSTVSKSTMPILPMPTAANYMALFNALVSGKKKNVAVAAVAHVRSKDTVESR